MIDPFHCGLFYNPIEHKCISHCEKYDTDECPLNVLIKEGKKMDEYISMEHRFISKASIHEPNPIKGDVIVLDLVRKDLESRAKFGKEKYGTYLMTNNGRNALMDAYQEALDLVMYLRQALYEKDGE